MAEVPDYVQALLRKQASAEAGAFGQQMFQMDPQTWRINLGVLMLLSVVMKALNDHGVILDAEWLTRLDSALEGDWPDWVLQQIDPNEVTS